MTPLLASGDVSPPFLTGPFVAALVLLGGAGFAKVLRPIPTMTALAAVGLTRGARCLVVMLGCLELIVCAVALASPKMVPALAASALYAAFAAFVAFLLLKGKTEVSCGCFGQEGMAIHPLHVAVNTALAAVCVSVSGASAVSFHRYVTHLTFEGIALFGTGVLCAYLVLVALTVVPHLERARLPGTADAKRRTLQPRPFVLQPPIHLPRQEPSID